MIFSSLINYSRQLTVLYNSAALDTPATDDVDSGLLLVPLLYDAEVTLDLSRAHPTHGLNAVSVAGCICIRRCRLFWALRAWNWEWSSINEFSSPP